MALAPGSRIGPYELTAVIGEGGMGKVWRAHHTALKRDDALKVLPEPFAADPERLARFRREAQVLVAGPLGTGHRFPYAVSRDGQRFLMYVEETGTTPAITVVLNWPSLLPN
jgi:hypothetical protein